jgi:hypothetical protein
MNQHQWAYRKVKESLVEYMRGVQPKASLEWAIGEVNSAVEKEWLSLEEVKGIVALVEMYASDVQRKTRLNHLHKNLGW